MSRNSSGTYTLPAGNPVASGTTISSTVQNNTTADLATEITNSLDRNGRGAMLAALALTDGAAGAPSLAFSLEPTSGLYRAAGNDVRLQIAGVQSQKWNASGTTISGTLALGGAITSNIPMTASNPASATGFTNTITPKSYSKAWANITITRPVGPVVITVNEGLNISGVAMASISPRFTFTNAMANATYAACGIVYQSGPYICRPIDMQTTYVTMGVWDIVGATDFNFTTMTIGTSWTLQLVVLAAQ